MRKMMRNHGRMGVHVALYPSQIPIMPQLLALPLTDPYNASAVGFVYFIFQGDADLRSSVQFVACGDLNDGDPDANYDLDPERYVHREAVQPPTAIPL